jgi:hypothetical protein
MAQRQRPSLIARRRVILFIWADLLASLWDKLPVGLGFIKQHLCGEVHKLQELNGSILSSEIWNKRVRYPNRGEY